jgi:3-mercaptopyruvate sulfurtransferase SseA
MKKLVKSFGCLVTFLLLFALSLAGCGSSVESKTKPTLSPASPDFPNANLLVSADSLQACLGQKNLLIIDARTSGYETSHIPGAINLLYGDYRTATGLKPVAVLESQLSAAGLNRNMTMVIYDDTTASWGAAGRIFWMLEYLGCEDVHILDGGWDKWSADGRPTETGRNTLPATTFTAAVKGDVLATKEHIMDRLMAEDFAIVDPRTDEEYIGWQLYGEARGGHIPKSVQIPYAWYYRSDKTVLSYQDLKEMFESRGVTTDKEVTSYCTAGIRSGFVYFLLRLMGYPRASNYDASILEWAAEDPGKYPLEKLKNYQALVYPGWVDALIKGENPPTYPGNGYVILETSYEPRYSENRSDYVGSNYEKGHIPGAIFLDTYSLENGPNSEYGEGYKFPEEGNVKPIPELQEFLGGMGISKDMTVIVYANDDISMMTAGRTAWALLLAGVDDVRLLNGSYAGWVAYGGAIETTPNFLSAVDFGDDPGNPQYLATTDDLKGVIEGTNTGPVIVDDRDWTEYIGESNSYYHYFHEFGRIPTAQWIGDWVELVRPDSQSLRTYTEVESRWTRCGFTPDKQMYFYCGTGWRSGLYTFYAYLMGWTAANYDGGWFEWSFYGNPRETGTPSSLPCY